VRRTRTVLERWAEANGFEILEKKHRSILTGRVGPFGFWTRTRNERIYSFRVRDQEGQERSGWARCDLKLGGALFNDEIEIKWDEKESIA